ncbi:uncharacterized protein LOC115229887 [Octopus sinensis]|uniref:Uncharacterized protein LOC115229887 n=1 Tax=Octopus sinensis TaxID=2607531 RepID=A0A6P7TW69_9MOLL|nr:uncharacterized protein LOC115229887 [Octopus sinensis]
MANRISDLATDFHNQLKTKISSFITSSIVIDESRAIMDVVRLAIFIRGVDKDLTVTEKFLDLILMVDITTTNKIFKTLDESNFTRVAPPTFIIKGEKMSLRAISLLKFDSNLAEIRYKLVPKCLTEVDFWRNYFYRVCLVQHSLQLKTNILFPIEQITDKDAITSDVREYSQLDCGVYQSEIQISSGVCGNNEISDSFSVIDTDTTNSSKSKNYNEECISKENEVDDTILSSCEESDINDEVRKELEKEGNLLRKEAESNSKIGQEIASILNSGGLVDDNLISDLALNIICSDNCSNGFILDGFPRTLRQAQLLDSKLSKINCSIKLVISVEVSPEVLIDRITGRLYHKSSGRVYHLKNNPPKNTMIDDYTNEPLERRSDDSVHVLNKRLENYNEQTEPVINYYQMSKLVKKIDGNRSINDQTIEIFNLIKTTRTNNNGINN